jgi:hypothetical protein
MAGPNRLVRCKYHEECKKSVGCDHGKPHVLDAHCPGVTAEICYDIYPARVAFCNPVDPEEDERCRR